MINQEKKQRVDNFALLPEMCYVFVEGEDVLCVVKLGENGYFRTDYKTNREKGEEFAIKMNSRLKVTTVQAEAMLNGSMFGWHTKSANVHYVTEQQMNPNREFVHENIFGCNECDAIRPKLNAHGYCKMCASNQRVGGSN